MRDADVSVLFLKLYPAPIGTQPKFVESLLQFRQGLRIFKILQGLGSKPRPGTRHDFLQCFNVCHRTQLASERTQKGQPLKGDLLAFVISLKLEQVHGSDVSF